MQEEKCMRINIVIMPSSEVATEVIALSRKIADSNDSEFVLDGKNFYPHITVYSPLYPEKNLDKVVGEVKDLVKNFKALELTARGVKAGQGYIGVEFDYTKEIKSFHETVVQKLNPFREGNYKSEYDASDYRMRISEEKKENIAKYGYPNAMSFYHPHMTISRLKDEVKAEQVASGLDWKIENFIANKIGAYKMGEHGACIELVKEFSLE